MAIRCILLPLLLLAAPLAAAERVELRLRDGTVIRGTVVSQDESQVVVESTVATRKGAMTASRAYPRRDIASIATLPDLLEEYRRRAPAATDAAGHVALARWCRGNGLAAEYRAEALLAIGLAPQDAEALDLMFDLGLMLLDGKWRPEAEVLAAQGKVRYQGEIMTTAEAAARKAAAERQQDADEAVGEGAAGLATCDRLLAANDRKRQQHDTDLANATAAAAASRDLVRQAAEARAAYDAAEAALQLTQEAVARSVPGSAAANAANAQLAEERRRAEGAVKAWNAAKRAVVGAEQAAAQQEARAARLRQERESLARQRDALLARRAALAKALAEAKAAQAQAQTPAAPATP